MPVRASAPFLFSPPRLFGGDGGATGPFERQNGEGGGKPLGFPVRFRKLRQKILEGEEASPRPFFFFSLFSKREREREREEREKPGEEGESKTRRKSEKRLFPFPTFFSPPRFFPSRGRKVEEAAHENPLPFVRSLLLRRAPFPRAANFETPRRGPGPAEEKGEKGKGGKAPFLRLFFREKTRGGTEEKKGGKGKRTFRGREATLSVPFVVSLPFPRFESPLPSLSFSFPPLSSEREGNREKKKKKRAFYTTASQKNSPPFSPSKTSKNNFENLDLESGKTTRRI